MWDHISWLAAASLPIGAGLLVATVRSQFVESAAQQQQRGHAL